jgi:hypothetical protein
MIIACYLEPQRKGANDLMRAFAEGCRGRVIRTGHFAPFADEHALMSTWPTTQRVLAECRVRDLPFWHLDSAWIHPVDTTQRYYRLTRNGCAPTLRLGHSLERAQTIGVKLKPWRTSGDHVLVCRQGQSSGKQWRLNPNAWNDAMIGRLAKLTDRPIRIREKVEREHRPLAADLDGAWAVVTHTSTCAVQAVIAGIPVFCAPENAAAAVGCSDLTRIEDPHMPERENWLAALAWGQWTIDELRAGLWQKKILGDEN